MTEEELSILTERQRTVYMLHQRGQTFQQIGDELGITRNAAWEHMRQAQRRIKEYVRYQGQRADDTCPADFPLTRGELKAIISALSLLEIELERNDTRLRRREDWRGHIPYTCRLVSGLYKRAQIACYGRPLRKSIFE